MSVVSIIVELKRGEYISANTFAGGQLVIEGGHTFIFPADPEDRAVVIERFRAALNVIESRKEC